MLLSGFKDGLRDGAVSAAAANVSAEPFGDLLAGGMGIFSEQRLRRHDLPWRAVTALRSDVADERLLERIQLVVSGHALDGQHGFFVRLEGQITTRADRPAIDQYRASAANFGFAGALGACQP